MGAFAGKNENGASISKSFSLGSVNGGNQTNHGGYTQSIGYFVGKAESGSTLFKCYYNNTMTIKVSNSSVTPNNTDGTGAAVDTLQSKEFLFDTLSWSDTAWTAREGEYPILS